MPELQTLQEQSDFDMEVELLMEAIFLKYQYDFRHYSRSSIRRRVAQLCHRLECDNVTQLQEKIIHNPSLLPVLLDHLTVSTTEMFRDPDYFLAFRKLVIPYLKTYPSLKVWIAGCSTGEEVYSLAIVLREEGLLDKTILYATDINPHNLENAKRGIYKRQCVQQASLNYQKSGGNDSLSSYYRAAYGAAQFDRSLVKNTVFSDHSLATDSVFAEVHFISCRNVLIYFDRTLQDRALGLFRESLVRDGFLGLGPKESLYFSVHREAFQVISEKEKIFQNKGH